MRVVNVSSLKCNEVLAKPIYDDEGRVLLNVGVKLTPYYVQKLNDMGIITINIDDDISKEIMIKEGITEKTRQMSKHAVKEVIEKYFKGGKADNNGIIKSVTTVIADVLANDDVLINVSEIRANDTNLYSHSVNVCILATLVATHMGYSMQKVRDIAVGAILHDIGKIKILNDKKTIAEFATKEDLDQYIKWNHSKVGHDFLSELNFCSAYSKSAALMHHEKMDGSGYPLKLKGNEIIDIAMLVSICNTFDNMISGIGKEAPKPIYEVIEYLIGMSNIYFDYEMVKKFTMNIAAFPTGSGVILNSYEKCIVVRQNKSMPLRPVVKTLYDKDGTEIIEPYEIDLIKDLSVFITKNCDL